MTIPFSSYEEQRDFELWAFGRSPVTYDFSVLMSWNSRFGDKLYIHSNSQIKDSLLKMKNIWKNELNEQ